MKPARLQPDISDEILYRRYSDSGDLSAFNELLNRNKGLVYGAINRYFRDSAKADEIFQEVFLKVCKKKDLFREAISFKSWLVTITRNTCIDALRSQGRTLKTDSFDAIRDDERSLTETLPSDGPSPADEAIGARETKDLMTILEKLPEEQRETFTLKVLSDLTFEEIAAGMNCSVNTAKSRYRYALETLRGLVRRRQRLTGTE